MANLETKHRIFELVRARLVERSDSLVRFHRHWQGSASGIEGWFKLEFIAAVDPAVAVVRTGSAGGKGRNGNVYPDLILEPPGEARIPIETKAGGNSWWYGGGDAGSKYRGHLLAFLSLTETPIYEKHRQAVQALDARVQLAPICEVHTSKGSRSFYLGMADLRI